jgi:hypothetical protein
MDSQQPCNIHQPVIFRATISFKETWKPLHWNRTVLSTVDRPRCTLGTKIMKSQMSNTLMLGVPILKHFPNDPPSTEYSINEQTEKWTVYNIYVLADCPTIDFEGELRAALHEIQKRLSVSGPLRSDGSRDSLVGEAEPCKQWSIATKGGPSGSSALRSDSSWWPGWEAGP